MLSRRTRPTDLQERFQRSGETIHRHFHEILDAISALAERYIVLPSMPSSELAENPKYHGQFSRCRLAFDGTHIPAFIRGDKAKAYHDRNGELSQNVFAACTFEMQFAYVLAGWEGSAADSTVLTDARTKGFHTPTGVFDLGDTGYGLTMEVLTPYRGVRYHLREWSKTQNGRPQNYKEYYNLRHAQARNVIERAFGVLKKRFPILATAPEYSPQVQAKIVLACCVLHNFIRRQNHPDDDPLGQFADDPNGNDQTEDAPAPSNGAASDQAAGRASQRRETQAANDQRDQIAHAMWESYLSYRRRSGLSRTYFNKSYSSSSCSHESRSSSAFMTTKMLARASSSIVLNARTSCGGVNESLYSACRI